MTHHLPFPLPLPTASTLLVVDIQEKLLPAMPRDAVVRFMRASKLMIELFAHAEASIIVTEQYPRGLGPTSAGVSQVLPSSARIFEKRAFSALREPTEDPLVFKEDVIIVGMETHVCVLQTALDLLAGGHRVFIVADGVLSRNESDLEAALTFLRDAGAFVLGCESFIFAYLERAEGDVFKKFSAAIR